MSLADLSLILAAGAGVYLAWQQNQIFKQQNAIFAAQAGVAMPEQPKKRLLRYWPIFAMVVVAIGVGTLLIFDRIGSTNKPAGAVAVAVPWIIVLGCVFIIAFLSTREKGQTRQSRLTIHSATYGARLPGAKHYDVTNCLRQMIQGDSLVFQIQNGNFVIGGHNYVPTDPREGEKKWLEVSYSFDDGPSVSVFRREDHRLILPEDEFLKGELREAQQQVTSRDTDIKNALRDTWECSKAKDAALKELQELKATNRLQPRQRDLFSPLQIEAFTIAKDLRDFLAGLPPFPSDPPQDFGEDYSAYLVRLIDVRPKIQGPWRQKLFHGYANRKFGERITALMHRAGEQVEYPAFVPAFAEKAPISADDVRKLAQQMEMMAIWINRKERGETDLLGAN